MEELRGRVLKRGEDGYEAARRAAIWNARTPDRFPDLIVVAADQQDVAAAVRLAAAEGLRIGVRSGGHSYAADALRDGGMLLDLGRLDRLEIDEEAMTAQVGPACTGGRLLPLLEQRGLAFPVGHCPGVALGGYLLNGGNGWGGGLWSPACASVAGIDVVTAAGDTVHADERTNVDLLWAARGSGPGFFAVVTGFDLRLHPRPKVVGHAVSTYPLELIEEVFVWERGIAQTADLQQELSLVLHRGQDGEPEIVVSGTVFADSEDKARAALATLQTCPVLDRARLNRPFAEVSMEDLSSRIGMSAPDNHRYCGDNMWTHAPIEALLPGLRRIAETLPPAPSHVIWSARRTARPAQPPMARSIFDEVSLTLFGTWTEAADDARFADWATERMREMEPFANGTDLAVENLGRRPTAFMTPGNLARVERLRAEWDPDGRFHSWMGGSGGG